MDNICYLSMETKKSSKDFDQSVNNGFGESIPSFLNPEKELTKANFFKMEFGVAATYDNSQFRLWNDPAELFLYLNSDEVDAIVTFNGEHFEFPVILGEIEPPTKQGDTWVFADGFKDAYIQLYAKAIDILDQVERTLGHRVKLEQLSSAFFEVSKDFDGSTWWTAFTSPGILKRTAATNALLASVLQVYKLYGIAREIGQLAFKDPLGNTKKFDIKIPTPSDLKDKDL